MQSVDPATLAGWIRNKEDFLLIDVREPCEHAHFNIGGILIPMGEIATRFKDIPTTNKVVIYCQKGIRSVIVIQRLQERYPSTIFFNLTGGMEAWKQHFGS
ncbi:MAG: rhodanese-like domain-containing protein [Chitinophagaceae bacterium]|nr:MAG: rhodanese-like domain-containing protein [Chitinophagaceae bacterium]